MHPDGVDDREDARKLVTGRDGGGMRPRGVAPDIDDVGAGCDGSFGVGERGREGVVLGTVGEGIRSDVEGGHKIGFAGAGAFGSWGGQNPVFGCWGDLDGTDLEDVGVVQGVFREWYHFEHGEVVLCLGRNLLVQEGGYRLVACRVYEMRDHTSVKLSSRCVVNAGGDSLVQGTEHEFALAHAWMWDDELADQIVQARPAIRRPSIHELVIIREDVDVDCTWTEAHARYSADNLFDFLDQTK